MLHPKVVQARSGWPYSGWVARSVVGVKYNGEKDRARFLGALLASSGATSLLTKADYIVPVPMFARKQEQRGYNQVQLMLEVACRLLDADRPISLLQQHEERPSQVGLSGRERRANVRGSFSLSPDFVVPSGARIALVDDVRTTGATLAACVDVLRLLRPRRIDVVTLAAELPPDAMEVIGLS